MYPQRKLCFFCSFSSSKESGKFLLVEFEILGFGIRNTAQGFRKPPTIVPMTKKREFGTWNQESGIRNPRSRIQRLSWIPLHGAIFWYLSRDTLVLSSKFSRVTRVRFPRQKDNFSCSCSFYKVFFISTCALLIRLAFFRVKNTLKIK